MNSIKKFILNNLEELPTLAKEIITYLENPCIVSFYGKMGAGKTTLIKALCIELGVIDTVTSPTFAIINEYKSSQGEFVYHFDFYRIENPGELIDIGVEDYFYRNSYCFIEWPEIAENIIPEEAIYLSIKEIENNKRIIEINTT